MINSLEELNEIDPNILKNFEEIRSTFGDNLTHL